MEGQKGIAASLDEDGQPPGRGLNVKDTVRVRVFLTMLFAFTENPPPH
jgi:hypothetical protein